MVDLGIGSMGCEIAHIRRNSTNQDRYDFTYLGPYAQAYDTLIDNELLTYRIADFSQLKRLREKLSKRIDESYEEKDKNKRIDFHSRLFQGREESNTFEEVRNSILFFADVFADKIYKFGKIYGVDKNE